MSEAYSEPSQTSEMELFDWKPFLNKSLIVTIDCNMYYCWKIKDLLIVKELIYCKEYFLIYQNKTFCNRSFCKSNLFTSQISFKIALTDVKDTLKQHWYNVISTLINVVQRWKSDFGFCFIFNVGYLNADLQCRKTLIRRWDVGWVVSMKKLILRNILPATLLTKWNF